MVVKPIGWRQACFTLFLLVVAAFFAVVNRFGPVVSWVGTLLTGLICLLSLLDQIFEWSRLKIDDRGYSLRGWFRNLWIDHHEIVDFQLVEFAGKKLLSVELKKDARLARNLDDQPLPFPCCFGRPVEDVLKIVRAQINRKPRARSSK
ncbi:MAG: hypothetical protein EBY48_05040 [Opitutae bacterium]|nr:hypothetical protein [Opitutae bacterium]